jgi:hypothetical protein
MKSTSLLLMILCSLEVFSQIPDSIHPLTIKKLMNATYNPSQHESLFDSNTRLKNGFHYDPNQYGIIDSVSYTQLDDRMVAFGDLNNDSIEDAAVIFYNVTGGSGCYLDLVAVLNKNGNPKSVASIGLGDRVQVKGIVIKKGVIELKMLSHYEEDGQCCPSKNTAPKFKIKGNKLVEITGVKFH